jgi:hypothetical protein
MYELAIRLNRIDYKKIIWLFAISETLHNLEEAIWLPGWTGTAKIAHLTVGAFEFRFAVTLITIIFLGIIFYFSKKENEPSKYLMGGALVIALFNVLVPHLIGAIFTGQYFPGVVTGVLLNIPVIIYLLRRGLAEGFFQIKMLILGGIGLAIIILPLLQLFFVLGNLLAGTI